MPSWLVWAGRVGLGLNLLSFLVNAGVFLLFNHPVNFYMALINGAYCLLCLLIVR